MARPTILSHRLTLDGLYLVAAAAILAIPPLVAPVSPHDFWWHMALGQEIVRTGQVPQADTFSFTCAGKPYFDQSWLAQVLFYALYRLGGLQALVLAQTLLIEVAYGLILWLTVRRTGRIRLAVLLLLLGVGPLSYGNWLLRPQTLALPLFALFLVTLTGYRLRWWRALWPLPAAMLVWVNLHGSFVLGLALIALVLACEAACRFGGEEGALAWPEWRRLAAWGAAAGAAALVNPRGPGVFLYVRGLVGSKAVTQLITEWGSPTVKEPVGALFFAAAVGLLVALVYARRRPCFTDRVVLLAFLWLAAGGLRHVIWFAMAAFPVAVEVLGTYLPAEKRQVGIAGANRALAALILLLPILAFPSVRSRLPVPPGWRLRIERGTPVDAVAWLRALPAAERPRRLFHSLAFGAYLIWACPEQRVFVDPRIELYPYPLHRDTIRLGMGCNVTRLLDKYHVDGLLLDRHSQGDLEREALASGRWRLVRESPDMALLLPRRP